MNFLPLYGPLDVTAINGLIAVDLGLDSGFCFCDNLLMNY